MTPKAEWVPQMLAVSALLVFGCTQYLLAFRIIPESNRELFIHLNGTIETLVVMVFGYYFGSSAGSRRKGEQLADK